LGAKLDVERLLKKLILPKTVHIRGNWGPQTEVRLSEDCLFLTLRGILFDEVFLTEPVFPECDQYISEDGVERYGRRFLRDFLLCMKSCDSTAEVAPLSAHAGQSREEAFWQTLICNTAGNNGVVVGDRMSASYHVYMDLLRIFIEEEGGITAEYYVERAALALRSALRKTIRGRIFCRTKN
jgi:hypothetical protein